uniref:Cytochrome c oxidase subunit 2 n=2 Tax=Neotrypaea TaxID=177237 RepID=A0A1S7J220_9EUCA|nr:cytochrome c oxidase subunit II [Neotrypaea japonica]YP_009353719.1 cytochrome c oxidase subunit II [Neotrypaea harmandi]AGE00857.1 cytochrome c oxidase subunit II [Neotrypaea japonica]URF19371.1 cytochrome c oxidase subunit II [Neotrypaea japonica]URF19384.1 cytochrome c oxidase subunit II [Neotrypaea japonica]URF19397.1 cytochrome c oxidase subunit II [Neotrypaea japonica]URF19410.1 cytochrome c oxidase subunit II [Neotrypaea japonica]
MTTWGYLGFQDSASPLMEQLAFFHDHAMVVIILIVSFVGYMMGSLFVNKYINRFLLENQNIEIVWTIVPAVILVFIALPSLRLLYLLDEVNNPSVTLKAVGHQWYWSYEYSDFVQVEFDSYMVPTVDLADNGFRLLDVDNRTVLPMNTQIRVLVSAADVIHSWTVPALGVKADAIPGRLNQVSFLINRPGLFYGQCSEICGANHSFMPIVIESVNVDSFLGWVSALAEE